MEQGGLPRDYHSQNFETLLRILASCPDKSMLASEVIQLKYGKAAVQSPGTRRNDLAPVILATGLPDFAGTAAPAFALNLVETYLDEIWVSYDGGITNRSCGVVGILPQWSSLGNGTFTVTFWANDTDDYAGTIAVLLHKDILAPALAIPSPAAGASFTSAPTFTVTVEDAQLDATWYTIGSDTGKHYFTGTSFTIDTDAWTALSDGELVIYVYAIDTLGNVRIVPVTITKVTDMGWLWIVMIGGIVAVLLVIEVIHKKRIAEDRIKA